MTPIVNVGQGSTADVGGATTAYMTISLAIGLAIGLLIGALVSVAAIWRLLPHQRRSRMSRPAGIAWLCGLLLSLPATTLISLSLYGQINREIFLRKTDDARLCAENAARAVAENSASRAWDWRWRYEACLDEQRALR
jgi:hypothetical protein